MGARGAKNEQGLLNDQAAAIGNNASSLYGSASTGYNGVLADPGFSKDQINTQTNAAVTPIAGQAASAQQALARRAAATNNSAGLVSGQDSAARTAGQQESQAAWGVQSNADQVSLNERDKALQGLSSLYGTTLNNSTSLYDIGQKAQATRTPSTYGVSLGKLGTFGATV